MKILSNIFLAILSVGILQSCTKEQIHQKEQDIAVSIMTSGSWIITKFWEGSENITSTFAGYECVFNADRTCVATRGSTKVSGTWNASTSSKTITGQFPEGTHPLPKINGAWKIVKSTAAFGEFTQIKNGVNYIMELTKK